MLNDTDWHIAKRLLSIANQVDSSKHVKEIISLLSKLLSSRCWYAFNLMPKRNNTSEIKQLRGLKLISGPMETSVSPTTMSKTKLAAQLQQYGGDAFPQLMQDSAKNGVACKVQLCNDTFFAFIVIRHDAPPYQPPIQLLLKFLPSSKPSHQKIQLVEALLPPIATCLNSHFFPYQLETPLTRREHQILTMVARGSKAAQVANELNITERTVNFHLGSAYRKFHARNRHEALCKAQQAGLITDREINVNNGIRSLSENEVHDIGGGISGSTVDVMQELYCQQVTEIPLKFSLMEPWSRTAYT